VKISAQALFLGIFFLYFSSPVFAAPVINEFSPQTNPEWVELYNPDDQQFSLSGVSVYFDATNINQRSSFCNDASIAAKSYLLITRPTDSYWLSNSGDTILFKKEDDVIDSISFGTGQLLKAPTGTQSAQKTESGWVISDVATPQGDQANFACPSSTPNPEPTNTPTPTSTTALATSTPTPSKTPAPTLTKTPTMTPVPLVEEEASEASEGGEEEMILGSAVESTGSARQLRAFAAASALVAAGLALISGVLVWQKRNALRDTLEK